MVIRGWFGDGLRSYSSWALWFRTWTSSRFSALCSSACGPVLPFKLSSCASSRWWRSPCCSSSAFCSSLCASRRFPCFPVGVPAPGSLAGSRGSLGLAAASSWPSACPSFPGFVFEELVYGIFADVDEVSYFGRCAAFSELRGARQVERFTACSFRHLPHVVFSPGG